MPNHVLGYGRLRDLNSQFQQFAVNAWCTPARVVAAHHPDQIPNLLRHAGPTSFVGSFRGLRQAKNPAGGIGSARLILDALRDEEGLSWRAIGGQLGIPAMTALDSYRNGCTKNVRPAQPDSSGKRNTKTVAK
jgi:hypothetical protein